MYHGGTEGTEKSGNELKKIEFKSLDILSVSVSPW